MNEMQMHLWIYGADKNVAPFYFYSFFDQFVS